MTCLRRATVSALTCLLVVATSGPAAAAEDRLPIADTHIHYSHDAWGLHSAMEAVGILRNAGVSLAFVSSSGDEGTQMLYREAPDLVVPVLRPYRQRGETGSWLRDESVIAYVEDRLARNRYAGIGEFHVYGADADLPVVRRMVELAREHRIFLHIHSDADAIERVFRQDADAVVQWAHAGFEPPATVAAMLLKYPTLRADLAFRRDHARNGSLTPDWRGVIMKFPDRFMLGTDTYTPDRWSDVGDHAEWSRAWLAELPPGVAARIATGNARALADWALGR